MGQITSNIGLITGIPIKDTVDQLMQIASRSRDLIAARNTELQGEGSAVAQLLAAALGVQAAGRRLAAPTLFAGKSVTSSNTSTLSATVTGAPTAGTYQFTPVRLAQNQHALSSGFASLDGDLPTGTLSLRFGGYVDEGVSLAELNGGQGVPRGKIRISDRSGATAEIDLRFAQSVEDVLTAINNNTTVSVTAQAVGDRLQLVDNTGGSAANLRVQEVGNGTTAAALGLSGINVAADSATGQDVVRLFNNLALGRLNGGNGVNFSREAADLVVTFRNGSSPLTIDLQNAKTLGDVLTAINAADPARLQAAIAPDGDRLQITDLTNDTGGTFSVASTGGGSVAKDLGLTTTASGGAINGDQLLSGLKTTLLSRLNGGTGLGQLGLLTLTDRSGASASVDLSAANTLDDVLAGINAAGLGITARVNDARNGLVLIDQTGQTASNLIVADGDATGTATKLGLAINSAVAKKDSGSRHLQVVSQQTLLADLNGGKGVSAGSIVITNAAGQAGVIRTGVEGVETVGDLIHAVNGLSNDVEARLNDAGDGILLIDKSGGAGTFTVRDVGNGKAARDLHLLGGAHEATIDGTPRQVVEGSTTLQVTIAEGDSLQDLIGKINGLDAGVTAGAFNDGSSVAPFRLSLLSQVSGQAGALQIDGSAAGISFEDLVKPQNALVVFGAGTEGAGFLTSSSSNKFDNLIDGLSLTAGATSTTAVNVTVSVASDSIASAVKAFADQYNKLRDKLKELTAFNADDQTTGFLFGTNEATAIDTQLGGLLSSRFFGVGSVQSLESVGLSLQDDGKLTFDADKFKAKFAEKPDDLKKLFTDENLGFAKKLDDRLERLVGEDNSLLVSRSQALQRKIEQNNERIAFQNSRLDVQRQRILKQFTDLESAIAKIQSNQSVISQIQPISLTS